MEVMGNMKSVIFAMLKMRAVGDEGMLESSGRVYCFYIKLNVKIHIFCSNDSRRMQFSYMNWDPNYPMYRNYFIVSCDFQIYVK